MKSKQSGFTLVEIAIVMVIIGLLLGGVLKGQAMVENARIKNASNDISGVQAMYFAYLDRKRTNPTPDTAYTTNPPTANKFWAQMQTEGLASGTLPPKNPWGGTIGVQAGVFTAAANVVCTSLPDNYAQAIDANLDDGVGTSGNIVASVAGSTLDTAAAAVGTSVGYGTSTSTYTTLCMKL